MNPTIYYHIVKNIIDIKNIIQIVEKYNGEYVIKNENNEFSFSIIIPL